MSEIKVKCPKCKGSKKVMGLGYIMKSCPICKGLGYILKCEPEVVKAEVKVEEPKEEEKKEIEKEEPKAEKKAKKAKKPKSLSDVV